MTKYLTFLKKKLKKNFEIIYLEICDETYKHRIKLNNLCLKITIVSNDFTDKNLFKRHQEIYKVVFKNRHNKIHAIEIYAYTYLEWKKNAKKEYLVINCLNK